MDEIFNQFTAGLQHSALLPLFFTIVILCFTIMSSIYLYHWRKYSMNTHVEHIAKVLYFGVSAFFIFDALVSLIAL